MDISKIQLEDGVYNVKDAKAREDIAGVGAGETLHGGIEEVCCTLVLVGKNYAIRKVEVGGIVAVDILQGDVFVEILLYLL